MYRLAALTGLLIVTAGVSDASAASDDSAVEVAAEDGAVERYVALAVERSPEVQAAFQRWESAVHRVARARSLPEPTLQFGVFVRSVETRVGPQQARISIQQAFPWPSKLTAGGKAASAEARAAEAMLEATSIAVALRVERAYWTLWEVRATRSLHREHLEIVGGLSQTVRARLEVGGATLADLQQIDLTAARLEDAIRSMDERELRAEATLRSVCGTRDVASMPTTTVPMRAQLPEDDLAEAVLTHPGIVSVGHRAEAADARARAMAANRLPGFTVGADWVMTGPAVMAGTPDSGKDAVIAGVGLKLPLWQGTYGHDIAAERAMAAAQRADQRGHGDRAIAELERTLSRVRDSDRRARVLSETLVPQAEAAYGSVLGNYTVGQSTVAQTLLSQRDLLALGVELANASAEHQRAWAQLDQLVGREVARTPVPEPENTP